MSRSAGFVMLDAIVGMGIAALLSTAFLASVHQAGVVSGHARDQHVAGLELLRTYEIGVALSLRDFSLLANAVCTVQYPCRFQQDGTEWSIQSGTSSLPGRFESSFYLESVARVGGQGTPIVDSGVIDTDTLALHVMVEWDRYGEVYSEQLSTYLFNVSE